MSHDPDADVTAQLLAYMDKTSDLVGVVDDNSRVVYLNDAARKRLGVGDATDLTTADVFPAHVFARYYDEIRPALLRTGTWSGELPVLDADGEALPMAVAVVARVGPGGEISGLVMHGREIRVLPSSPPSPALLGRDDLTDLPQRSILYDRMDIALARADRYGQLVGVILIDVDALKDVNDTFGHTVGDELLRALARRVERGVRDVDTVARVGGDEFVVLLDGVAGREAAIELANRVREAVCRASFDTSAGALAVTASFGVATGEAGDEVNELLRRADAAMYRAKAMGGGHVVTFDDSAEVSVTTIADEFAVAVSHGFIRPHVQPVVDLRTGELAGYQGLARWEHHERGTLEAADFIDLVSNTPMAPVVDLAVLRRTAAVAARAARRGRKVRAYGHVSRRLIGDPSVDHYLAEMANDLALSLSDICVEIAHPLISRGSRAVRGAMRAFRDAGVRTVLSEVHGECEVDELVEHGFDELRLSRHLVRAATTDVPRRRVVAATVALAHALELPVMAVGVETERARDAMVDAGCDLAEGFLFGAVVPSGFAE